MIRRRFAFGAPALLLISVGLTFAKRIPVYSGPKQLAVLEGWRKLCVLVPSYSIALSVCFFPHQIACAANLRGYVCG